jgi:hypothetical protein
MIGEALAAACADRDVLARIGGPIGEAARRARGELAAVPDAARRAKRAGWATVARSPVPAGLRGVDRSWIEAALAGLPSRARAAVAGVGDAHDLEIDVWLARWACAAIPPLPPIDASLTRPRSIADAARLSPDALRAWIEAAGADQLAFALGDRDAIARAGRVAGDRVIAAAERILRPPRAGALGPRRAAIARGRVTLDDRAYLVIGARALAPHVATHPLLAAQLSVRLPRDLGLAAELRAHASTPVEQCPAWPALCA